MNGWKVEKDGHIHYYIKNGWRVFSNGFEWVIIDPKGNRRAKYYKTLAKAFDYCERRF